MPLIVDYKVPCRHNPNT